MGKNTLKVYIDPKSNKDKVSTIVDTLTKMNSKITRGDDNGEEYIIIERNTSVVEMSSTTNPIRGEFDDTCDPVLAAYQLAELVDNIL